MMNEVTHLGQSSSIAALLTPDSSLQLRLTDVEEGDLHMDELPILGAYWVKPGQIIAGEYPGSDDTEFAQAMLRSLLEAGVSVFFDLTSKGELEPYQNALAKEAERFGSVPEYQKWPIRDMSANTVKKMTELLDAIDESVDAGKTVYLHCAAGLGRTGVVVGCYLVRHGMSGEEALEAIPRMRRRDIPGHTMVSPETQAQRNMIREWGQ
jgi:protein-tyrosine phosphatase